MKTSLPVGTFVRYRYRNAWEYAQVVRLASGALAIQLALLLPDGAPVEQCVWKGERLERRRTITFSSEKEDQR